MSCPRELRTRLRALEALYGVYFPGQLTWALEAPSGDGKTRDLSVTGPGCWQWLTLNRDGVDPVQADALGRLIVEMGNLLPDLLPHADDVLAARR